MTTVDPHASRDRCVSPGWRALASCLLLALLLGGAASDSVVDQLTAQMGHLRAKVAVVPQNRHLAVLPDEPQLPAMRVTMDPQTSLLQLQRLNEVKERREHSMQLWALDGDKPPHSLGVIERKYKTLQLPIKEAALAGVGQVAISVEAKGGACPGCAKAR